MLSFSGGACWGCGRIASPSAGEILRATAETIEREGLSCARPLPKEVRTHIAVARAFTGKVE